MKTTNNLGKNLGYVRRHNKALLRHLLKSYTEHGLYENFGQATLRQMDDTINKYLSFMNYRNICILKQENRDIISYFNNSLSSNYLKQCYMFLQETKLYECKNVTGDPHFWSKYKY